MDVFSLPAVDQIVDLALAEDLGRGDLTTRLTVPAERRAYAEIVAKQAGVLAGVPLVRKVYQRLNGAQVTVKEEAADGETFEAGTAELREVEADHGPAESQPGEPEPVAESLEHPLRELQRARRRRVATGQQRGLRGDRQGPRHQRGS